MRTRASTHSACVCDARTSGWVCRTSRGQWKGPSAFLVHLFSLTRLRLRLRLNLESHFPIFVHAVVCPEGTRADTGL
jgi:hypothetical protein